MKSSKVKKFPRDFKKDSAHNVAVEVTTQAKILSSALSLS